MKRLLEYKCVLECFKSYFRNFIKCFFFRVLIGVKGSCNFALICLMQFLQISEMNFYVKEFSCNLSKDVEKSDDLAEDLRKV